MVPHALMRIASWLWPKHQSLCIVEPLHYAQNEVALDANTDSREAARDKRFNERIKCIIKENIPGIFRDKVGFPPLWKWVHDIDVGDAKPLRRYGWPLTPPEHEAIHSFINNGLKDGVIEPSKLPWFSPLLPVPKKDGMSRICVDYQALNELTKSNAYLLPRIDKCYCNLASARYFTCLDLRSGYWQIRLAEDVKEKTITSFMIICLSIIPKLGLCSWGNTDFHSTLMSMSFGCSHAESVPRNS